MKFTSGPVSVESLPTARLDARQWDEIWALGERFTDTTRAFYEESVRSKKIFVLIRERGSGRLVGMGGIDPFLTTYQGRQLGVLYTGNLVFEAGIRGQALVERIGFLHFLEMRLRHPLTAIWLFYDTYSYKTYLILPRNFEEFWPRPEREMPAWEAGFLDHLGRARYGESWDPARGICVRSGQRTLRPWVAPIDDAMLANSHVHYYRARNPGYREGDMLAVLIPLHFRNWFGLFRRLLRRRKEPV